MSYNRVQRMREYASAKFYDDAPAQVGAMVCIECEEEAFHIIKLNWGAEEDYERSIDGEVELSWTVQGEALERLKKTCNNAKTSEEVVDYLKKRFGSYGRSACQELLNWLQKKQIAYSFSVY